jgi:ABC-type multidrug transport system fused ATPase/permease subunit
MMHGRGGGFTSDDLKGKIYDRRLYGRMAHYLKPYLKWVIISFLVLMLVTMAELVLPLIQRSAIDDHIVSDKSIAIFTDEAEYQSFMQRYAVLKFHEYSQNNVHFVVISASDKQKLDVQDLQSLEQEGILSPHSVFLVDDNPANETILSKNLLMDANPEDGVSDLSGYFKIGGAKIAVARDQMMQLSRLDRLDVRKDSSKALLWLALLYFGIIVIRFISGYTQAVLTATFSQKAMNDLRHDVFEHMQKMPTKYFDQNPVGRLEPE